MDKIQTQDHIQPRKGRGKLIWRFLKGSKALFILCMICAAVSAFTEMIIPQIIKITIDNVIGGKGTEDLAQPVQSLLASLGGTEALRQRMWIMAMAVLAVAAVCAAARRYRALSWRSWRTCSRKTICPSSWTRSRR